MPTLDRHGLSCGMAYWFGQVKIWLRLVDQSKSSCPPGVQKDQAGCEKMVCG